MSLFSPSASFNTPEFFFCKALIGVSIEISGHVNAGVIHQVLQGFGVHFRLRFSGAESVPQNMGPDFRMAKIFVRWKWQVRKYYFSPL